MYKQIENEILSLGNKEKASVLTRFFKTWKWEYWEWDLFLWITVPQERAIAKKHFKECWLSDIEKLIKWENSKYHEVRMIWFLILCYKYELTTKIKDNNSQEKIISFYLTNLKYWNNRDLVDLVCYKILWHYLYDKDRTILYKLSESKNLREQRVAIISTMYFVKKWDFNDALNISKSLLWHPHDLIHKAAWRILREIWKKDEKALIDFLDENINNMHRTTLRYAIEKFDKQTRQYYLKK